MIDVFDPPSVSDPYPALARLRTHAPVHRVPGTQVHLVTSWDLVQEVLTDTATYSSHLRRVLLRGPGGQARALPMDGGGTVEQVLATADDPDHHLHRAAVTTTIGRRIRAMDAAVDEEVARLWSAYLGDGRGDWARDIADRLPLAVVAQLIGLDAADLPALLRWAYDSTEMLGGLVDEQRLGTSVEASLELHAYLDDVFATALAAPGDHLMGELARRCHTGDLAPATAVLMLLQLVGAGGESTAGLIGTAGHLLARDGDLQERLRSAPELVAPFLDECLRLESPFRGHYRHVVRDAELGGRHLPAGSTLLLLWGAANRDPARFERPDELDLERPGIRSHLAFGRGAHFCLGSALARMEASSAVRMLLARTRSFGLDGADAQEWVPSIFVRRHARLRLTWT